MAYVTCLGNDLGYGEHIYLGVRNLMRPGDIVVAISASGNSPNAIKAVDYANQHGATSVGIVGFYGGLMKKKAQHVIHVKSERGEYVRRRGCPHGSGPFDFYIFGASLKSRPSWFQKVSRIQFTKKGKTLPLINLEDKEDFAIVRLNNGATNALSFDLVNELSEAITRVKKDFKGMVLAGGEKFFSIGFDFRRSWNLTDPV